MEVVLKYEEKNVNFRESEEIIKFIKLAEENSAYDFLIPRIKTNLEFLVSKGEKREKLLSSIKEVILSNFSKYVESHITFSAQIPGIGKYMQSLINLGFEKEMLLNSVKDLIISNFSIFVEDERYLKGYEQKVNIFMDELKKIGINPDVLEEIVERHNNIIYMKDFKRNKGK